jgi:flagellar motility protein MotE (MotC chaperone)
MQKQNKRYLKLLKLRDSFKNSISTKEVNELKELYKRIKKDK